MAVNKPIGNNARKGVCGNRSQLEDCDRRRETLDEAQQKESSSVHGSEDKPLLRQGPIQGSAKKRGSHRVKAIIAKARSPRGRSKKLVRTEQLCLKA